MSEFSQTVPELVAWARKNDFSISLPVDRLSFLLAVATLNGERLEGEMTEGELVDAFRHVSDAFEQTSETISQRANNAINDMVRQRLLNRFTSEITEGNAIYRLTPLGIGITDYYIRQREFSTLRLSMQLSIVAGELAFATWRIDTKPGRMTELPAELSGRILLVTDGEVGLSTGADELVLQCGQSAFIRAGEQVHASGDGQAFMVATGMDA